MQLPKQIGDFFLSTDETFLLHQKIKDIVASEEGKGKNRSLSDFSIEFAGIHFPIATYEFLDGGLGSAQLVLCGMEKDAGVEPMLIFVEETDGHCEDINYFPAESVFTEDLFEEQIERAFILFVKRVNRSGDYHDLIDVEEYKQFVKQFW